MKWDEPLNRREGQTNQINIKPGESKMDSRTARARGPLTSESGNEEEEAPGAGNAQGQECGDA